jgi:hypothetical protein
MRHSSDLGVAEIALFGWGLYSDDDLIVACLKGENAIDPANRRIAERCLQFLTTDLEFSWPRTIDHWIRRLVIFLLASIAAASGFLIGLILLILVAIDGFRGGWATTYLSLTAVAFLLVSAVIAWGANRYERRKQERERQRYCAAGDRDVWPFHTLTEYRAIAASPTV